MSEAQKFYGRDFDGTEEAIDTAKADIEAVGNPASYFPTRGEIPDPVVWYFPGYPFGREWPVSAAETPDFYHTTLRLCHTGSYWFPDEFDPFRVLVPIYELKNPAPGDFTLFDGAVAIFMATGGAPGIYSHGMSWADCIYTRWLTNFGEYARARHARIWEDLMAWIEENPLPDDVDNSEIESALATARKSIQALETKIAEIRKWPIH